MALHGGQCRFVERQRQIDPLQCGFAVNTLTLAADPFAAQPLGDRAGGAGAEERIEHHVTLVGGGEHHPVKQRLRLLRWVDLCAALLEPFLARTDRQHPVRTHLQFVVERLHQTVVEGVLGLLPHRAPDQRFVRVGKAGAFEIGHRVGLAPDHVVKDPEPHVLHHRAKAEDIVIAADHPDRAIGLQHPARLGQPLAAKLVIGRKAVELVPVIGHRINMAAIGARQVTAKLQVVGRIGENHVDTVGRQRAHRLDAIAIEDLPQGQIGPRDLISGAQPRLFPNQKLSHSAFKSPKVIHRVSPPVSHVKRKLAGILGIHGHQMVNTARNGT